MTRPILSPLEPIFKPDIQWGETAIGTTLGSIGAAASPGIVTATVSTLTPTVSVRNTLYFDDFNRADNGNINTGAPAGMTYNDTANFNIVSNRLELSSPFEGYCQLQVAISPNNMWAEIDVVSDPDVAWAGLVVRVESGGDPDRYMFRVFGNNFGPRGYEIYKKVSGVYTQLAVVNENPPATPFRIGVEVDNTSIRGYLVSGGTRIIKVTGALDAAITGTSLGIWQQIFSGNTIVDNFAAGTL